MKRRTLFIILGLVLAVVVIAGGGFLLYVRSLMVLPPLTVSYATVETERPAGSTCFGANENSPGIAKEVLNLQTGAIYVAGGANPMPDDVWVNYSFMLPYMKNSTRHLLFTGSCFFRSPGISPDCAGDACFTTTDQFGYSWLLLTTRNGSVCYPDASGCFGADVQPGYVSINTISKCHELTFEGTIYELSDGAGNRYVMHATATGTPNITDVRLPSGWTLEARTLDAPLVLLPHGGGANCYYNIVRDNLVQSYHQYVYAGDTYPAADSTAGS